MRRRGFLRLAAMTGTAAATTSPWAIGCGDRVATAAGLPSSDEMMSWIGTIVARGIRRPGYPADRGIEGWAAERFSEFGLEDVHFEAVSLPSWEPHRAEVVLDPAGTRLTGMQMPHSATGSAEAELALLAGGPVEGRIAVHEFEPIVLPQAGARLLATSVYDPTGEFDTLQQILPFDAAFNGVMEPAVAGGAAGMIGLLTGFPWETRDYYVPYDAVARPIPGIWLSGGDGRRLLERMSAGPVRARIEVEADRRPITTNNVIGTLPGNSDEWVVVASHHDAPWASAVEDASGVSLVLAQARHWASVPRAERPHNLLFLLTSGHMAAGAGTAAFIASHADLLDRIVLEVHLEHAARRCDGVDGELIPTDDPEVRWWFTSRNPRLEARVAEAIAAHDLRRSLIFRPEVFFENPPTDGALFHAAGVPLVQFLTAPMYLFDSRDTLDKIHQPSLESVSRATARIIASTREETAASMRAGVVGA